MSDDEMSTKFRITSTKKKKKIHSSDGISLFEKLKKSDPGVTYVCFSGNKNPLSKKMVQYMSNNSSNRT